jgi:hypothetical protein
VRNCELERDEAGKRTNMPAILQRRSFGGESDEVRWIKA